MQLGSQRGDLGDGLVGLGAQRAVLLLERLAQQRLLREARLELVDLRALCRLAPPRRANPH